MSELLFTMGVTIFTCHLILVYLRSLSGLCGKGLRSCDYRNFKTTIRWHSLIHTPFSVPIIIVHVFFVFLFLPVTRSHHSILYIVCNMVSNDRGPVRTGTNNLEERVSGSGLGDPPLTLKMRVICICFLLSVPDTKSSVSFEWTSNSPR